MTTWVAGFTARRFVDPEAVRTYAADGGVLLIDEARSDTVLAAVQSCTPRLDRSASSPLGTHRPDELAATLGPRPTG